MQLIFKPEKQGRVCSTSESEIIMNTILLAVSIRHQTAQHNPLVSLLLTFIYDQQNFANLNGDFKEWFTCNNKSLECKEKEFIYIVVFFLGQTGKISRKQNNCEWRVFPGPSLTFGRQKGKEQHLYFLHIMLLSGSHRVKKEIHTCCGAQKYISEVLSWFYQHSAAGSSNSIPGGTNKILIWNFGS